MRFATTCCIRYIAKFSIFTKITLTSMLSVALLVSQAVSVEIDCEKIETIDHDKICFLDKRTAVRTTSVTFYPGSDGNVRAISFSFNQKVEFLPIQVGQKFPNLVQYRAANCAVRRVTKDNFEGLVKLEALRLSGNRIEKIASDTFEGLSNLKLVYIGKQLSNQNNREI